MSRFTGPNGIYVMLDVNDFAVVDFRTSSNGEPTNVTKDPKRITMFFKKNCDFSSAKCVFGIYEPCIIRLSS